MPITPTSRSSRRALGATVVALGAAAFLLTRSWTGSTERMLALSSGQSGQVIGVQAGQLYYREWRPDSARFVIRAVPVRGGAARLVVDEPTVPTDPAEISLAPDAIYYRYRDPKPTTRPLPNTAPLRAGERSWSRLPRIRLRRVPLVGGTSQEVLPEVRSIDLRVSGKYCYWVRSEVLEPGPPLRRPAGHPPRSELMVSPLAGGPAHHVALRAGVLYPGTDGVFWEMLESQRRVLFHTYPPDFPLQVVTPLESQTSRVVPVQLGGRLYWTHGSAGNDPRHQLVSCRPDGSDLQVVLEVDRRQSLSRLQSSGADLIFTRELPQQEGKPPLAVLCRLHPGEAKARDLSSPIAGLEGFLWLDGGYAYFLRSEQRENWFDWSARGLSQSRLPVLHRVRLW